MLETLKDVAVSHMRLSHNPEGGIVPESHKALVGVSRQGWISIPVPPFLVDLAGDAEAQTIEGRIEFSFQATDPSKRGFNERMGSYVLQGTQILHTVPDARGVDPFVHLLESWSVAPSKKGFDSSRIAAALGLGVQTRDDHMSITDELLFPVPQHEVAEYHQGSKINIGVPKLISLIFLQAGITESQGINESFP